MQKPVFDLPIKITFKGLKARGIVSSRFDMREKIRAGKLRPPHKDGEAQQSPAWWFGFEIAEDLQREYEALTGAAPPRPQPRKPKAAEGTINAE